MSESEFFRTQRIGKKFYRAVVLKVQDEDLDGRPRGVTVMYDQDFTRLKGGEKFFIVFAPEVMLKPTREMPDVS